MRFIFLRELLFAIAGNENSFSCWVFIFAVFRVSRLIKSTVSDFLLHATDKWTSVIRCKTSDSVAIRVTLSYFQVLLCVNVFALLIEYLFINLWTSRFSAQTKRWNDISSFSFLTKETFWMNDSNKNLLVMFVHIILLARKWEPIKNLLFLLIVVKTDKKTRARKNFMPQSVHYYTIFKQEIRYTVHCKRMLKISI